MEVVDKKNLKILQSKITTKEEFDYDTMYTVPLYSLLSQYDIDRLYNVATSIKYAGNAKKKFEEIDKILHPRGFSKLSQGTNRICYQFFEDPNICIKVAADRTGIKDNPREFLNQAYLKPFCTKVFETSPCGTVGLFERVKPIQNREEFYSVADQIYDLIDLITSKYILADFGTHFFMNYGFRKFHNFGPVILDFPYLYEADARKLVCKKPITLPDGKVELCGGLIDYDFGFNKLYCTKCGAEYRAVELAKYVNENLILQKGNNSMEKFKIVAIKNGVETKLYDTVMQDSTATIAPEKTASTGKMVVRAERVPVDEFGKAIEEPVAPKTEGIVRPNNSGNTEGKSMFKVNATRVPVTGNYKAKKQNDKQSGKKNFKNEVSKEIKDVNNKDKGPKKPEVPEAAPEKINELKKTAPIDNKDIVKATPKTPVAKAINIDPENWIITEHDLENHLFVFESKQTGEKVTLSSLIFTVEMLETLVPDWETSKSATEELELAKMDVRRLEEEMLKLKKENEDLRASDSENIKLLQEGTDLYDKTIEEKSVLEDKVAELEAKLAEKENDLQANGEAYDEVEDSVKKLEAEVADLTQQLKEAQSKSDQFEEYVDKANAEIEDLKTQVAAYEESAEVVNEPAEGEEVVEGDEEYTIGFSKLSGKLSTIGAIAKNAGMEEIPEDCAETDHVIAFEDGQGGYFTDQYGNVIVVSDINGKLLANSELKIAPKKE